MASTNGVSLDTFPSRTQAWNAAPEYAALVVQLGLAQRVGVSVERRRLPGQSRTGRSRRTYDIVLSRHTGTSKPLREARLIRDELSQSATA